MEKTAVKKKTLAGRIKALLLGQGVFQEGGVMVYFLVICLVFYILNPNFLSAYNVKSVLRQISFLSLVTIAQMLTLLLGGIDVSVGAVGGLCGIAAAWLMAGSSINPFICLLMGVVCGLFCGTINGLLITKVKLNPFIATLGTSSFYGGMTMVITKGWAITKLPENIDFLGNGFLFGIPIPFIIALAAFVVLHFFLKYTPLGRSLYAVGDNKAASVLVGININRVQILVYALAGMFAALAGVLMVCKLSSGQPTIGGTWVMSSIAAAVIGGTSMTGGVGTALGVLLGTFIMGVIGNGLVLANVSPYWQSVVIGLIVLAAVSFDVFKRSLKA